MALAPIQPEWALDAAPAKARTKLSGGKGTTFTNPLRATGSTAPEAKRAIVSGGAPLPPNNLWLTTTARVAPPTYPTVAVNMCRIAPPEVDPERIAQPIPVASTETKAAEAACPNGEGSVPGVDARASACERYSAWATAKRGHVCSGKETSLSVSFASMRR